MVLNNSINLIVSYDIYNIHVYIEIGRYFENYMTNDQSNMQEYNNKNVENIW